MLQQIINYGQKESEFFEKIRFLRYAENGTITRYLLYFLLIFTPLARGSVQGWAIYLIHMITITALIFFLLHKTLTWKWERIKTPLDKPILALLILCLLSSVFSVHRPTSFRAMALLLNYLIIFYLVIHTVRTRSQLRQLIYLIIGIAVFLSVFGLLKKFEINPFTLWDYKDLNYSHIYISSTYGNRNHFAGYLEMAIPLIFLFPNRSLRARKTVYDKSSKLFLSIYLSIIMITALIFSLSRGGWISSFISMSFIFICLIFNRYFRHKILITVIAAGIMILALIILSSTPVVERILTITEQKELTLKARMTVWISVTEMISDYPMLGTGPGTFSVIFTQYQPPGLASHFTMAHNDYLHFISETGLLLIPILIWTGFVFYGRCFQKLKHPSRLVRGTTLSAMAGITAILIHSISDFNLHIPANAMLFTVLAGIAVAPPPTNK